LSGIRLSEKGVEDSLSGFSVSLVQENPLSLGERYDAYFVNFTMAFLHEDTSDYLGKDKVYVSL
jgi:hypothetical protein